MIGPAMAQQPGVTEVHDLHIWDVTSGMPALSAHVLVEPDGDCHAVRRGLEHLLQSDYRIRHTTLQVDHAGADFGTPSPLPDPTAARPAGASATPDGSPGSSGTGAADTGRILVQQDDCQDPHGPRHHPVAGRVDSPASPPH